MNIYFLNLILLIFSAVLLKEFKIKNSRSIFIIVASFQLFLLLALRDKYVGSDVIRYMNHFEQVKNLSFNTINSQRHEIGYVLFSKLVSLFTQNARVFITIIAGITILSISILIKRYSKLPFISFYLYITLGLYSFTFSGLRQTLAYSITLFSYKYIRERNFLKFSLLVILASLFHTSAFIFIFAYFLATIGLTKINIIKYFIVLAVVFMLRFKIMTVVTSIFYSNYPVYESGAYTIFLLTLCVVVCSLILNKNVIADDKNSIINYNLVMFSLLLIAFSSTNSNVLRVANYYYFYIILLLPDIIFAIKDKYLKFMLSGITIILTFLQYIYLTPSSHLRIVPYLFFWQ